MNKIITFVNISVHVKWSLSTWHGTSVGYERRRSSRYGGSLQIYWI